MDGHPPPGGKRGVGHQVVTRVPTQGFGEGNSPTVANHVRYRPSVGIVDVTSRAGCRSTDSVWLLSDTVIERMYHMVQ
jgi:hypothetical protein